MVRAGYENLLPLMSIIYTFNITMGSTSYKEQSKQVYASQEMDGGPDWGVLEAGFIIIIGISHGIFHGI